jgi:beta-ureidopropionase / N-carbamoyl-L-amino-acid hydrolase
MDRISSSARLAAAQADLFIDPRRLDARLEELGRIGHDERGGRTRLALTSEDKDGRDLVVRWLQEAGARVCVDRIGNIYGVSEGRSDAPPIMTGSHIDTVARAGALDGCYGVLAGIEVLQVLRDRGLCPNRRIVVAAFTNEEGARFTPDLLGSRVIAKDISLEAALALAARDGAVIGDELRRIGYAGEMSPWELLPHAFVELHIEQGPILDAEQMPIGVVEGVQGHSWWRITIEGTANHAGTTPMRMRRDAGTAAMALALRLSEHARTHGIPDVATVGVMKLEPGSINVVPGRAEFTLDLRDPRDEALHAAEQFLAQALSELDASGLRSSSQQLSRHPAVVFDRQLCALIEAQAKELGLATRRMSSGASHDAQMMARLCPTAMIFVPSSKGISHNPREHTDASQLHAGANLLLRTVLRLASD